MVGQYFPCVSSAINFSIRLVLCDIRHHAKAVVNHHHQPVTCLFFYLDHRPIGGTHDRAPIEAAKSPLVAWCCDPSSGLYASASWSARAPSDAAPGSEARRACIASK